MFHRASIVPALIVLAASGCTSAVPQAGSPGATGEATTSPTTAGSSLTPGSPSRPPATSTDAAPSPVTTSIATPVTLAELPTIQGWAVEHMANIGGSEMAIFADDHVWVVNEKDRSDTAGVPNGEIYKIDPVTLEVVATVEHARGGFPTVGEGAIWLINAEFGQTVTRIDLDTLQVDRFKSSATEDPSPEAVAVAGGYVWVGNNHDGTVAQVDPDTLDVVKTIRVAQPGGWGVRGQAATDGMSVWFGISRTGEIIRIDAATGEEVSRVRLPNVPHESLPDGVSQSESSPPETLLAIGDALWAQTIDHIYVIDISTVGEERIVGDIHTSGIWDSKPVGDDAANIWSLVYSDSEPIEATGIVQIDTSKRTAVGQIPLEGIDGFGRLIVTDDRIFIRTEGKLFALTRK